jgi:hypothetical protein
VFWPQVERSVSCSCSAGYGPTTTSSGSGEPLRTMTHHNGGNVLLLFLLLTSVIDSQHNNGLCEERKWWQQISYGSCLNGDTSNLIFGNSLNIYLDGPCYARIFASWGKQNKTPTYS